MSLLLAQEGENLAGPGSDPRLRQRLDFAAAAPGWVAVLSCCEPQSVRFAVTSSQLMRQYIGHALTSRQGRPLSTVKHSWPGAYAISEVNGVSYPLVSGPSHRPQGFYCRDDCCRGHQDSNVVEYVTQIHSQTQYLDRLKYVAHNNQSYYSY
jgi:hypothetical protein